MKIYDLKFRIYNKIFNKINFKLFNIAKFISKIFIQSYNSTSLNQYKVDIFLQNSEKEIETPSLKYLIKTIDFYRKEFGQFPKTILDYGGATGENAIFINKLYNNKFYYTVLENEKLVKLAKASKLNHCEFIYNVDKNRKFDIVYSSATLQYLDDPYLTLRIFLNHSENIISLARLNCNEQEKVKLQVSYFKKNIGYQDANHKLNNSLAIYPVKELNIKKIKSIFSNFKIESEEFLEDKMYYFIFRKKNIKPNNLD